VSLTAKTELVSELEAQLEELKISLATAGEAAESNAASDAELNAAKADAESQLSQLQESSAQLQEELEQTKAALETAEREVRQSPLSFFIFR